MPSERYEKRQELLAKKEVLVELSQHDDLTGLSNRRNFDRVLLNVWHCAIRNKDALSLIMIDIDHFKDFNDSYGHIVRDDCLKVVAKSLENATKRSGDLVSRYGGEEFVIILPNAN